MKGKKVLITRAKEDNKEFREQLERKGAIVVEKPMIHFTQIEDLTEIHSYLNHLETIDWIVFTSAQTVSHFFKIAESYNVKFYFYPNLKIATVGEKTKLKLELLGYRTNFVPIQYTAEVLAENMDENIAGKRILIPQSSLASKEYLRVFEKRGATPIPVTIYNTKAVEYPVDEFCDVINEKFDYLTFTSGSTFKAFYQNMTKAKKTLNAEKIISIGPSTSLVIGENNLTVNGSAMPHTVEGMVRAIEKLEENV
ncbi:MAG: uroporphyrinogen-III synthase [Vicingaceae bacterium]|jgi:uroporphyrinogen-III synthase